MIAAVDESLLQLAKKFENLVVLNSDCNFDSGLKNFPRFFEERFLNFGLAQGNMASSAAGFTVRGKIPFLIGFASQLPLKAFKQIRDDICYPNLNVKIIGTQAGISSAQMGPSMHATSDIALMRSLPNMKVLVPSNYFETKSAIEAMMVDYGPTYLRLNIEREEDSLQKSFSFKFGSSEVVRKGRKMAVLSLGSMTGLVSRVVNEMADEGFDLHLINVSSFKPLDEKLIKKLGRKFEVLVTIEDHSLIGGLYSAVKEVVSEGVKVRGIGIEDKFGRSEPLSDLRSFLELSEEAVKEKLKAFMREI